MTSDAFDLRNSDSGFELESGASSSGANDAFFIELGESASTSVETPTTQLADRLSNAQPRKATPPPRPQKRKRRGKVWIEVDEEQELTLSQKIERAILGFLGVGFATSLLVHFFSAILLVFAAWLFGVKLPIGTGGVEVNASISDGQDDSFEELDSSLELAGGAEVLQETSTEIQQVPISEMSPKKLMKQQPIFGAPKLGKGNDSKEKIGRDGSGFKYKMPGGGKAVTKGSFTAWTVPEDPLPGQNYKIIIQIKFPARKKLKNYYLKDLKGMVIGTDNYRQFIPAGDPRMYARRRLKVIKNMVQYSVTVPGAGQLVKDTIKIRSKMLKEDQTLEIVF